MRPELLCVNHDTVQSVAIARILYSCDISLVYISLSVCLSVYLSLYLSVCLCVCVSVSLSLL